MAGSAQITVAAGKHGRNQDGSAKQRLGNPLPYLGHGTAYLVAENQGQIGPRLHAVMKE
jgi:hypothetical protein